MINPVKIINGVQVNAGILLTRSEEFTAASPPVLGSVQLPPPHEEEVKHLHKLKIQFFNVRGHEAAARAHPTAASSLLYHCYLCLKSPS